jgi:hypothetical protein
MEDTEYKQLLNNNDGVFRISGTDFLNQTEIIPSANTSAVINIGFSKRKIKALYFALRRNDKITTDAGVTLTGRDKGYITNYALKYNGSVIGQNSINSSETNESETFAELAKASGGILNLHANCFGIDNKFNLSDGDCSTNAESGSFFGKIDLENGFQSDEALSGLEVLGGNLTLELTKSASSADQRLDLFVEYHSEYVLDMNDGGGTWGVYS